MRFISKGETTSTEHINACGVSALITSPPAVDIAMATSVASDCFSLVGPVQALSGERDRNFRIGAIGRKRVVLKFINSSESPVETDLQIAVLNHIAALKNNDLLVPHPINNVCGRSVSLVQDRNNKKCYVRAYTYLEGKPATQVPGSVGLRHSIGRELANLNVLMSNFNHSGVQRYFLWDIMRLGSLREFCYFVSELSIRQFIVKFIEVFRVSLLPELRQLRCQVIHNDLSKSNFVVHVDDNNKVSGILDFGDMTHAPLILDLAIAASYQMEDTDNPMAAMNEMIEGYESVQPLTELEHTVLLDLVIARLVQRIVITEWRATQFPDNSIYMRTAQKQSMK